MTWVQQNYLVVFGITWVAALIYMVSAFVMVLRLKSVRARARARGGQLTGYAGNISDTIGLLKFLWSSAHRDLNDGFLSGMVSLTRALFLVAGPLILFGFYMALSGNAVRVG